MMKPTLNDIKALIEQAEKLKQEVEQLKKKSFLTPVQSESIKDRKRGVDIALYLLQLSEEEGWNNFGVVDTYFTLTGSLNSGRFAANLGDRYEGPEPIEWYDPNKHKGLFVRYDFDEKKFRRFLNQDTAKRRQLYWKKHIQPLIIQLDTDLTPWLPFLKAYIDTDGIQEAIKTAEPVKLSDVIYKFKKIQRVVETEVKQELAGTGPEKGQNIEANQNNHQSEIPYEISLTEEIADKLESWAEERKTGFQNKIEEERQNENRYKTIGEFLKEQDTFSSIEELSPIATYFALPDLSDEFTFAVKSFQFNENFTPATMLVEIQNKLYYKNIEIIKLAAEVSEHLDSYEPESFEYKSLLLQVRTFFAVTIPDIAERIRKIAEMTRKKIADSNQTLPIEKKSDNKPAETRQNNKEQLKTMLHPTIKSIVEIIEKLKTLQAKVIDLINKKSIVPDDKEETKDNIAKILKTMQQAEILKMQREGSWPEDIKRLMNEIIVSLFPYLDYLKEKGTSGKWEQASVEYFIKAGIPSNLDIVIQELEKIKHKMKVEAEQAIEPAGRGQKTGDKAGETKPSDLITLTVAVKKFQVSKTTLRRAIDDGRLKNYGEKKSLLMVSESKVAKRWPRR